MRYIADKEKERAGRYLQYLNHVSINRYKIAKASPGVYYLISPDNTRVNTQGTSLNEIIKILETLYNFINTETNVEGVITL